ncbi:type IV pilus modification PilV family protein [Rugamonas apoptosis]|uniref:Prepilin-type N-terminal cleavage/methylation domain-containing protein n=1 Tax=Rugamonas apoptosis TaxID=2758570 RepID=A0A7W2F9C4_9BURK|nr:prepilin-type N-terminal cleavage/methylation domain-containing protein [Rugamonas apoptosis]MBA5687538.1 prepilin-type N-terminal cleavage/methylation domain-containing protein [Rugamonas apoptosis]
MFTSPQRRQRGLSLIELVMFMVIMGVAAVTVLQLLNISTKASAEPVRRKQALLLAEALMEEVQQARFTFCDPSDINAATATSAATGASGDTTKCDATVENFGPENGEKRPYNNVNDYVTTYGMAQESFLNAAGNQLVDAADQPMGGQPPLTGFTATVSMEPATLGPAGMTVTGGTTPVNMEALRITIKVDYGNGNDVTLDGYRTRYAPRTAD